MKKNTFLWILVALVVFFFVFGMGKSVYEGFCTSNGDCPGLVTNGGRTYCRACKNGGCAQGKLKIAGAPCN